MKEATGSAGTFRSLGNRNFRVWSAGALMSNIGVWIQRIVQDWLILTELTDHDARAVGLVVALQFGPQLLLLPWTGWSVDHLDRRKLLIATQAAMGILAVIQGALTLTGAVHAWHIYLLAFLLGCATAFDAPTRQAFAADMVGDRDLSNAVALNSMSFNISRLVGPAVAGLLIATLGSGWTFLLNAMSFVGALASLRLIRVGDLVRGDVSAHARGNLIHTVRYAFGRHDLRVLLSMLLIFGSFGQLYPVFISTMAASVFHIGAEGFGLAMSALAIGSVAGALLSARRETPTVGFVVMWALALGCGYAAAAAMPTYASFGAALVVVGMAAQAINTAAMSLVQLTSETRMRGRVVALGICASLGGQLAAAPLVGWIAHSLGPRWGIVVGSASGFATAAIGTVYLLRPRNFGAQGDDGGITFWQLPSRGSSAGDVDIDAAASARPGDRSC